MANLRASIESIWSLLWQVTPISTGQSFHLVADKTKNNYRIKSQVRKKAPDFDNDPDEEQYQESFYPVVKDNRGRKDIL